MVKLDNKVHGTFDRCTKIENPRLRIRYMFYQMNLVKILVV
ncbi:hypothetical protein DYY67_0360 [Candidatus Nitrosotalea sp. TS]|nr:hypothetical protein [Candidatus Nitrosotalea sp. TS]